MIFNRESLRVIALGPDAVRHDVNTTATLATGTPVSGFIDTFDLAGGPDADWYRVSLTAGLGYLFNLTSASLDGMLGLRNAAGTELYSVDRDGAGGPEALAFNPTTGGTYYLAVQGFGSSTGSFGLSAAVVPVDTIPAGPNNTLPLAMPGALGGRIDPIDRSGAADEDWYPVSLLAGTSYQFNLASASLDGMLAVYDPSGLRLASVDNSGIGGPETLAFEPSSSGTYHVAVSAYNHATTGTFTLSADFQDLVPAGPQSLVPLGSNSSLQGVIGLADLDGGADEDWYQVALFAGVPYRFNLDSPGFDGVLDILNASGVLLGTVDLHGSGNPESLPFTAATDGIYFVAVSSYQGTSTGGFTLSAATVDFVPATPATTYGVPIPGMIVGLVDAPDLNGPDEDWYAVTLVLGASYQFDLSGASIDGVLAVYSSNGTQVAFADNASLGGSETLVYSPQGSGSFYVGVSSWQGSTTGGFTLASSVSGGGPLGLDTVPASTSTTAVVALGASINGVINSNTDLGDWYRVSLVAGGTYQFDLSELVLDGQLSLYSSNGSYLTGADSGYDGDPESLVYSALQSGSYYIGVSGYQGSVGYFQLAFSQPSVGGGQDTVGDSVATSGALAVPGQVIGSINSGTDADWYAVDLSAGTRYEFDLNSNFIDGVLVLVDAVGNQQAFADNGQHAGDPENLTFIPDIAGTYYVAVSGFGGTEGSFQLDAAGFVIQGNDFVGASAASAAALVVPGTEWGVIDSSASGGGADADWYSVRLNAGATYRVDLALQATLDGVLTLHGTDGASSLGREDSGYLGEDEYFYFTPTTTGNYFIGVEGFGGGTGEFLLTVAQVLAGNPAIDSVGQTPGTSASVAVSPLAPGHVDGTVNSTGDADWYGVTLAAGTQYEFRLGAASLDSVLQLYDAQGDPLDYVDNSWGGGDPEILVYTPATAGTFYVGVSGYADSTGDFLLDINATRAGSSADLVGDGYLDAAANLLQVGAGPVRSVVDSAADEDVYAVTLSANTTYLFELSSNLLDGTLALYGPLGHLLDSADYGGIGGSENLYFTPLASGTFYIGAGGWSASTGSFALELSGLGLVGGEVPGGIGSTARLPVPGFVDNQIDPVQVGTAADTDWFSIRLHQGSSYLFYLYSNDGTLDGQIQMFDAAGNPVFDAFGNGFVDDGWYAGDAETLGFTAAATGSYFIGVSGYGGSTGSYSLYSAEALDVDTIAWADTAGYADIKWNVLDWVSLDAAGWAAFDQVPVNAAFVDWQELQYEHRYDALDPGAHYAAWNLDFSGAADPGNDNVNGGAAADSVLLGLGLDNFNGAQGNDSANGGAGADSLDGGSGNDTLDGGSGSDALAGGAGDDTYYVDNASDLVFEADDPLLKLALNLGSNIDKVVASISYTLTRAVENLTLAAADGALLGTGNGSDNMLAGNGNANTLIGLGGADTLDGNDGNDTLDGGAGVDQLRGGTGNDQLDGGAGDDQLAGGGGNDVFMLAAQGNGVDQISDFALGDAIQITGAVLSGSVTPGNGAGLGPNQARLGSGAGNTTLYVGTDAVAGADVEIRVNGIHGAAEFALAGNRITLVAAGTAIDFLAYSWKAHTLLGDVGISSSERSASTLADGSASFQAVTGATLAMSASRPITPAEANASAAAVNLQDAIAILKMIVGLDVNAANRPLSPYQALAADFDGNGTVGLTDAIGVLRHVVGLAAPAPAWHFANATDPSVPGMANLSPGLPPALQADLAGTSPVHVGLVGYLGGDVDGSYGGAPTAPDLDLTQPGYFQALVAAHPALSLAQFGIYG